MIRWPSQKYFPTNFDMGEKNAESDADFESVEKVVKKAHTNKVISLRV